jgi:hypothetical protein
MISPTQSDSRLEDAGVVEEQKKNKKKNQKNQKNQKNEKKEKNESDDGTEEHSRSHGLGLASLLAVEDGIVYKPEAEDHTRWYRRLLDAGVEENGIKPVPVEERTNTQYNNLFTVFFTGLLCILP